MLVVYCVYSPHSTPHTMVDRLGLAAVGWLLGGAGRAMPRDICVIDQQLQCVTALTLLGSLCPLAVVTQHLTY